MLRIAESQNAFVGLVPLIYVLIALNLILFCPYLLVLQVSSRLSLKLSIICKVAALEYLSGDLLKWPETTRPLFSDYNSSELLFPVVYYPIGFIGWVRSCNPKAYLSLIPEWSIVPGELIAVGDLAMGKCKLATTPKWPSLEMEEILPLKRSLKLVLLSSLYLSALLAKWGLPLISGYYFIRSNFKS